MPRKTIAVATVLTAVNQALQSTDSFLRLQDSKGEALTAEQAFRLGQASVLEQVLHRTDNYKGFTYTAVVHYGDENTPQDLGDETRRQYFTSRLVAQDLA